MISKEAFIKYLEQYQKFGEAVERLEEALIGKKYSSNIYESDWNQAVDIMFDEFLKTHFNEAGQDLIYWYLFEDVDKIIYYPKDIFGEDMQIELNSLEDLWKYLISNKEEYFNE